MDLLEPIGQQLGNYRLIRLLGQGGFANVYLAEHLYLGTQAAIKILQTQLTSSDIENFRSEARTIALLVGQLANSLPRNQEKGEVWFVE